MDTGHSGRACPKLRRFQGDDGSNLVEYALLVALIVLVCLLAVSFFAKNVSSKMSCTASSIGASTGARC